MSLRESIERVKTWMRDHAAAVLVENLADGATAAELDAFEASCGYPLPSDLRTRAWPDPCSKLCASGLLAELELCCSGQVLVFRVRDRRAILEPQARNRTYRRRWFRPSPPRSGSVRSCAFDRSLYSPCSPLLAVERLQRPPPHPPRHRPPPRRRARRSGSTR